MDWTLLGFQGLRQIVNIHPVFVHFPVALFPLSLLFFLFSLKWRKETFLFAGRVILLLATVSAGLALATGLFAEDSFTHTESLHRMIETHETIGYVVAGLGVLLSAWSFFGRNGRPRFFPAFTLLLGFLCLTVFQTADIGGRMVFVEGASVKQKPAAVGQPHDHGHSGHSH